MNINDLTEQQLNTLAALGQGWWAEENSVCNVWCGPHPDDGKVSTIIPVDQYDPCNNGNQAMELLEKYGIAVIPPELSGLKSWAAGSKRHYLGEQDGDHELADAPKLAITRAFVASKYGTEIDYDAIVGGE